MGKRQKRRKSEAEEEERSCEIDGEKYNIGRKEGRMTTPLGNGRHDLEAHASSKSEMTCNNYKKGYAGTEGATEEMCGIWEGTNWQPGLVEN